MKRIVFGSLLSVGILALIGNLPAFGMVSGEIKAKIPFDFRVGTAKLPAGEYLIVSAAADQPNILEIRNMGDGPSALVVTQAASPKKGVQDRCELQFRKVGGEEYLTRIWESTIDTGDRVPEPAISKNLSSQRPADRVDSHGQSAQKP